MCNKERETLRGPTRTTVICKVQAKITEVKGPIHIRYPDFAKVSCRNCSIKSKYSPSSRTCVFNVGK